MADIQQWRKKIQPSKTRTPLEPEDIPDVPPSPRTTTPNKRCLKKKVSSYFDLGQTSKTAPFQEQGPTSHLPAWPLGELYPDPKPEDEMDSVMCRIMSEPHARLDVRYNCSLMRIFESYAKMKEEKDELEQKVQEEAGTTQSVISKYNMAQKDWEDERQDYKDEIKRLEVLLAKSSKRGVAEVTLARQDSKLRRRRLHKEDQRETIFEFLEKSNRNSGRFYDNQRATMKSSPLSPSHNDRTWSQKLTQKKSMTNIHADLPFGTPPDEDLRFSLTQASFLEQQTELKTRQRAVTNSTTESDDTFSSFACEGALLPQVTVTGNTGQDQAASEDFADIGCLASAVAQRRNIDPAHVVPQLMSIFEPHRDMPPNDTLGNTNALGLAAPQPPRKASTRMVSADSGVTKRKTVKSKASDLFHKLKPQLGVDSPSSSMRSLHRRFSFEPGDDAAAQRMPLEDGVQGSREERTLRKSVSVDVMRDNPPTMTAVVDRSLSPVPSSPTVSICHADGRPPSRIPTPTYSSSLAKPRQEREDSTSSLLTAIRQSDEASKRSNSLSSSVYSSPSPRTEDFNPSRVLQYSDYALTLSLRNSSSNRLLSHTKSLRNKTASAAPRYASSSGDAHIDYRTHGKQPSARSNHSHSGYSDKSNSRLENAQPMGTRSTANDATR